MKTVAFLNSLRSRLASEVHLILGRGERRPDGCVTALEEDTCRHNAKRIHSINAELAQLKTQPTTKGRRGRRTSELREEQRVAEPEPQSVSSNPWADACHESGHGVTAECLGAGLLGLDRRQCTYQTMDAVVALAGAVAERIAGFDGHHSDSDLRNARSAILAKGWKDIDQQIVVAEARAKELLAARWSFVQAVAGAVYRRGSLTGDQVRAVMRQTAWELQEQDRHSLQHAHAQRTTRRFAW